MNTLYILRSPTTARCIPDARAPTCRQLRRPPVNVRSPPQLGNMLRKDGGGTFGVRFAKGIQETERGQRRLIGHCAIFRYIRVPSTGVSCNTVVCHYHLLYETKLKITRGSAQRNVPIISHFKGYKTGHYEFVWILARKSPTLV